MYHDNKDNDNASMEKPSVYGLCIEDADQHQQIRGFEGPEKRLLAQFFWPATPKYNTNNHNNNSNIDREQGLRKFSAAKWQGLLDLAKCTIISQTSNAHFDSYVLSESSLFVYPTKVLLKTCGTTTLLHCVEKLMDFADEAGLELERIVFSRKNYVFPKEQQAPHTDWNNEVVHLNALFDGEAHVIGPLTGEHWFVYVADYSHLRTANALLEEAGHNNASTSSDSDEDSNEANAMSGSDDDEQPSSATTLRSSTTSSSLMMMATDDAEDEVTLEVMMHGLSEPVCRSFYRQEHIGERDKYAGVAELLPGSTTDEFNFSPCGYSMNGLRDAHYSTIHVTPEVHCSYASFETNARLSSAERLELVRRVLRLFQPSTATVTLFASSHDAAPRQLLPCELSAGSAHYRIRHQSRTSLDADCSIHALTLQRDSAQLPTMRKRNYSPTGSPPSSRLSL